MLDSPDEADDALRRVQARARQITTLAAWQQRATSSAVFLHEQLLQAQADLERVCELVTIQQHLLEIDLDDAPPPQLVEVWRAGSPGYVPVRVSIDDAVVTLIVHGPPRVADMVREVYDWHRVQQVWREVHRNIRGAA
ncbi:hypothetical protein ACFQ08_03930 [Streptosporangium algeriense]|uniref:Uncharacterized protein n=1 Tax=Streptosporangium algeriense TaxID=1682748 RepID=A0ABW3DIK2_9ACTN